METAVLTAMVFAAKAIAASVNISLPWAKKFGHQKKELPVCFPFPAKQYIIRAVWVSNT